MSGTVTPDQPAQAAMPPQAGQGHRSGRRRWAAAGAGAVAVAAVVLAITDPFGPPGSPGAGAAGSSHPVATAMVTLRSLASQTQVAATLGDVGSYTVVNQAQGTITALSAAGQVVRQGQMLYQVNGSPVVLLYGPVPAYRDLSEGLTGPDVTELNTDLVTLGYATRSQLGPSKDYFSSGTAYALEKLQARLGVPQDGVLALGQAVLLPAAALITGLGQTTVLGGPAQPGSVLLSASSTIPVVIIDLDAAQRTEVRDGQQVTITLPDGSNTPGVVSSVSNVATASSSGSSGSQGSSGRSGSSPTITVEVTLTHPRAARGLDQAPVEVTITTGSVNSALVVPVNALLARAGGGYAVEVTGAAGARHLVPVSLGLFDDAAGLVQVTGPGMAVGQHVVVPGI